MVALYFGISPVLGPILGATAALLIAGDPRGLIWTRKTSGATSAHGGADSRLIVSQTT